MLIEVTLTDVADKSRSLILALKEGALALTFRDPLDGAMRTFHVDYGEMLRALQLLMPPEVSEP